MVADASIDPRILESARRVFLEKGYGGAQLKEICQEAGVTTGALYKRYQGKEDLFGALVEPVVREISEITEMRKSCDPGSLSDAELLGCWSMYGSGHSYSMQEWFDFLYARKDEFTLLLRCSEGTRYSGVLGKCVAAMSDETHLYLEEACRRGMVDRPVSPAELRVLMAAFWTMISQPFLENFDREQLCAHCAIVNEMFHWEKILGLHMPG